MNRDQMIAHLTIHGWALQKSDYWVGVYRSQSGMAYYHHVSSVPFTNEIRRATEFEAMSDYASEAWSFIPDEKLTELLRFITENNL